MSFVEGAEAGLDVADEDAFVEGGQGAGPDGGGVALDEDPVGTLAAKHGSNGFQDADGDVEQILAGPHQVEIDIRSDLEEVEDLVEHLPVLGGGTSSADQRAPVFFGVGVSIVRHLTIIPGSGAVEDDELIDLRG